MFVVEHLFLDSLLFLRVLPSSARVVLDLGSGAGLPGLPIKIVRPEIELTLIESRRRRASFLSTVVRELQLERTEVIADRIENRLRELGNRFDAVLMRCAGGLDALIPSATNVVVPNGLVIAAGPPRPGPLAYGEWVTVPGLQPGETRRFAVYRRPAST
jgi:16S rRNA (guanine527-N7)-methyltransferase